MSTSRSISSRAGFTLIELMVAVGVFAFVMTIASGAYLVMIGVNRQAQGIATGIDDLSFALEYMTRDIRTGSEYCVAGCSATSFSFKNNNGATVTYALDNVNHTITKDASPLTGPSVEVSTLTFSAYGRLSSDTTQANVTIAVSGTISSGSGGKTQAFTIETGATMRGTDI